MLETFAATDEDIRILLTICGMILAIPVVFYLNDLWRRRKKDNPKDSN